MHGNSVPDHVISELYQVPENIRLEYLRVKVLELLVTLRTVDPTVLGVERPYFYKTQVEKVKAIMSFMTNERSTISQWRSFLKSSIFPLLL